MAMRVHPSLPPQGALLFAPMEGITDHLYRQVILELYPEWDKVSTDFLRIPKETNYPIFRMRDHLGHQVLADENLLRKTTFQILTCAKANIVPFIENLNSLNIPHLDLNIGCPSKTVTSHGGGSRLLERPEELAHVLRSIRRHYHGLFTTKIRVGFNHDELFLDNVKMLIDEGVDAITIHGRTRAQLYHGRASWHYFERAVAIADIPIFGNGDIWTLADIDNVFQQTGCWGIMCGRTALKTPWLARLWNKGEHRFTEQELLDIRRVEIKRYFHALWNTFNQEIPPASALKRMKSLIRFIFDDFPDGEARKSSFLRSQDPQLVQEYSWS